MLYPAQKSATKVAGILTSKLLALSQSSFEDLSQSCWNGTEGTRALKFLIDLSGLHKTVQPDTARMTGRSVTAEDGFTQIPRVRAF